jgi:hypothetical protein
LHLVDAFNEVFMAKLCSTSAKSHHASFNAYCLELCAIEFLGATSKLLKVHIILVYVHLAGVDLHNAGSSLLIRKGQLNLSVKSSRTKKSWVKDVWSVSCRNDLDPVILGEPIELIEEFEHSSVNFTGLTFSTSSFGANCIELINKNDGGSFFSCELEGITNHLGTISNEHLD